MLGHPGSHCFRGTGVVIFRFMQEQLGLQSTPAQKPGFADEALPCLDSVYRFALRLTGGRTDDAEDLVQETFLRAHRSWDTYQAGTNCRSWLFTICRHAFLRDAETRARRPDTQAAELTAEAESFASVLYFDEVRNADPARAFYDSFVDEEVMAALDHLPREFREAVSMADIEGMAYEDIAAVLQVPKGTVKSRIFRGRRLLQKALFEYAKYMGYIK
jgi:RNA polymerase sigma-70 factor, ECF subfamily